MGAGEECLKNGVVAMLTPPRGWWDMDRSWCHWPWQHVDRWGPRQEKCEQHAAGDAWPEPVGGNGVEKVETARKGRLLEVQLSRGLEKRVVSREQRRVKAGFYFVKQKIK